MDYKKELTKSLIATGLKELMLVMPFEKITIRMITERAGVIRPTFYYHFQDKYEVLEWIVRNETLGGARELLKRGMEEEAIKLIFGCLCEEREFYKKAFEVIGQNGFADAFTHEVFDMVMEHTENYRLKAPPMRLLTRDSVAGMWATNLVSSVKMWLLSGPEDATAEELTEVHSYLMRHSLGECFEKNNE